MEKLIGFAKAFAAVAGVPFIIAMVVYLANDVSTLKQSVGVIQGQMKAVDIQFDQADRDRVEISRELGTGISEVNESIVALQKTLEVSQLDLGKLLVRMGTVPRGSVFDAAVVGKDIWVFPIEPDLDKYMQSKGLERASVNKAVSGYRVLPAAMLLQE